ncbi:MAG: 5-deoxy-glucuronate isomerase, partial [Bacteroides sp.]
MKTNYEIRYAAHPDDAKSYDTTRIRKDFLIERVFASNEVNMVYSMYDRMIVGGAMPMGETLKLEAIDPLKAPFFLTRREMGIFNVGGPGVVKAGDATFDLDYKEALYLGSGDREVTFESKDAKNPAKFYFNSVNAHRNYSDKKVTKKDAVVAEMGTLEGSNRRNVNKMLVSQVLPTCQ